VSRSCRIGRGADAELRIPDQKVSRSHAIVKPTGAGLSLQDLGSSHGTYVDGQRVGETEVRAGQNSIVRVGDTLLMVCEQADRWSARARVLSAKALGLPQDLLAGPSLAALWDQAARVADLREPVLILGESGTGKEVIARVIHAAQGKKGPFVGINIAAIPEGLFESELFGHERGAFSGAVHARRGAFREAHGGALFLDEVADLRLDLQAKLLRAIDLRSVRPLGADRDESVDVRLLAATSVDLSNPDNRSAFRLDLYYRLAGTVLRIPPLRERRDDILLLALHTLEEQAPGVTLSTDAAETLALASWEGNIRHLRFALSHAVTRLRMEGGDTIRASHLPPLTRGQQDEELTADVLRDAMRRANGVVSRAAKLLQISRTTFYNACRRAGVDPSGLRP
jgi:transcriptional regulator with PAS, ATPase and Fis domain